MSVANPFGTSAAETSDVTSPAYNAMVISPSNTVNFTFVARAIYVGTSGDITLLTANDQVVLFANAPVGILPVLCKRVNSTGTDASDLVALW